MVRQHHSSGLPRSGPRRIKRLTNDRDRFVTYVKRRAGLVKKAMELCILTGCEISLIVFAEDGEPYEFNSNKERLVDLLKHPIPPHVSLDLDDHHRFIREDDNAPTPEMFKPSSVINRPVPATPTPVYGLRHPRLCHTPLPLASSCASSAELNRARTSFIAGPTEPPGSVAAVITDEANATVSIPTFSFIREPAPLQFVHSHHANAPSSGPDHQSQLRKASSTYCCPDDSADEDPEIMSLVSPTSTQLTSMCDVEACSSTWAAAQRTQNDDNKSSVPLSVTPCNIQVVGHGQQLRYRKRARLNLSDVALSLLPHELHASGVHVGSTMDMLYPATPEEFGLCPSLDFDLFN